MELSSIGKSDRAAPLALGAWARDARRNRLAPHLPETRGKDLTAVSGITAPPAWWLEVGKLILINKIARMQLLTRVQPCQPKHESVPSHKS